MEAKLAVRLSTHFRSQGYLSASSVLKRGGRNWRVFAAVGGATLAASTSASADNILFASGPVSTSTLSGPASIGQLSSTIRTVHLKNGSGHIIPANFDFFVEQANVAGKLHGQAGVGDVHFLETTNLQFVKKLASGTAISAGGHFGSSVLATQKFSAGHVETKHGGWTAGKSGVAGFSFQTSGGKHDYGWVRLVYTVGANGAANNITALNWAYNSTPGVSILAEQTSSIPGTPEPASGALMFLAAGAAGVATLRRRRQSVT